MKVYLQGLLAGISLLGAVACTTQQQYNKQLTELQSLRKSHEKLKKDSVELANQADELVMMLGNERKEKEYHMSESEQLRLLKQKIQSQNEELQYLKSSILKALIDFDTEDLHIYVEQGKVYVSLSDRLLFESGSVEVDEDGGEAIVLLANVLKHHPEIHIMIEGHTDNVPVSKHKGTFRDNWELSTARATAVARILAEQQHISPNRMTIIGKGEFYPKASNDTEEGRKMNRRTEIILSPKLDILLEAIMQPEQLSWQKGKEGPETGIVYTSPRISSKEPISEEKLIEPLQSNKKQKASFASYQAEKVPQKAYNSLQIEWLQACLWCVEQWQQLSQKSYRFLAAHPVVQGLAFRWELWRGRPSSGSQKA
jgi:chemotaxis protein MotB